MTHSGDGTTDALQRMKANGDDLTRPRDVEFTVVFPNKESAEQFAENFRALGYKSSVDFTETDESFPWDVIVVKHMMPSGKEISDFEGILETVAHVLGGHNDGWGCFSG
jgi:Regulator of ribonuclease activity B